MEVNWTYAKETSEQHYKTKAFMDPTMKTKKAEDQRIHVKEQ